MGGKSRGNLGTTFIVWFGEGRLVQVEILLKWEVLEDEQKR